MGEESEALKTDIEHRRQSMTDTIDAIEDKVVPSRIIERRRAAVAGWGSRVKDRVMGPVHSAGDQASSVSGKLGEGLSNATDAVGNAPEQMQRATAGSPLIAGAVAFGVGALVAVLLPETEPEQRAVAAVQPQLAAATEAVRDVGQQTMETAKSSAQDATQELKDSATGHAQDMAEQAKEATQEVKGTAQQSSERSE